jgi:hypothetical protein
LFVLLVLLVAVAKIPFEEQALVAGTKQNLSNLFFLDIYDSHTAFKKGMSGGYILCKSTTLTLQPAFPDYNNVILNWCHLHLFEAQT